MNADEATDGDRATLATGGRAAGATVNDKQTDEDRAATTTKETKADEAAKQA